MTMTASERAEVLSAIKHVALKLSSLHEQSGIQSGTYYWTAGYPLNIRLYEKLLLGVFDGLDEGQLIEVYANVRSRNFLCWLVLSLIKLNFLYSVFIRKLMNSWNLSS